MIQKVRQNLFEFQKTVISDDLVLTKLNEAYHEVYNILIKQYPDVIAKTITLPVTFNNDKIMLPRELKSSRVLSVYSESFNRRIQLQQIEYSEYVRMAANKIYPTSLEFPMCYALNRGELYLYPKVSNNTLTIMYVPELIELGHLIGNIDRVNSNNLPLYATSEYIDSLADEQNVITVSDSETGFIKATFEATAISQGVQLNVARKQRYKGLDITSVETSYFEKAYISGTDLVVIGSSNLSSGDVVYIDSPLTPYTEYYTSYGMSLLSTIPDLTYTNLNFSGLYTVSNIVGTGITLTPATPIEYNMPIKNGYNTTFSGVLNTAVIDFTVLEVGVDYTIISAPDHGLGELNDVTWISVLTGPAYIKATVLSSQALEISYEVVAETQIQAKVVEVNPDYLYSFPRLFTAGVERTNANVLQGVKNSLIQYENTQEIYENDLVSLGSTGGTHILDSHFEKYLVYYATALIKDSIQEDAALLMRMLDGILRDVHADIGTRKLNRRMIRETPIVNNAISWRTRK